MNDDVWDGNDMLKNIFDEIGSTGDSKSDGNEERSDSKVIIVLELPVGGSLSKYSIGDTDDVLEVEIRKHSLMLNPKALLFSGIQAGVLDEAVDGPRTARGGICLNECTKG